MVADVFSGGQVPAHLATRETAADVRRVLRDGGVYAQVVADGPPLAFARGQAATLREVFREVAAVAEPGVLRGRRFGNVLLLASPVALPVDGLTRLVAGDPSPGRVVHGDDLDRFVGSAEAVTDASAVPSPAPPASPFARR